uniref:Lipid-binding serum glycoprotein C-terminal domain-containing protein n=1 Tax=Setaria digitata TaxID=48799 RepID=A0A915PVA3_9BILA
MEVIIWKCSTATNIIIDVTDAIPSIDKMDFSTEQRKEQESVRQSRGAGFRKVIGTPPGSITYINRAPPKVPQRVVDTRGYYGKASPMVSIGGAGRVIMVQPTDFNPELRGQYGNPGIKVRLNQRAFQYLATLATSIVNREIVRVSIPDIRQEIEEISGEITVCNIYVSNYRPPACLYIFPAPPNMIIINLEDFDVGVSGNLFGMGKLLIPIKLYGIAHANFYHISATISLSLFRSVYGTPQIVVSGCDIKVPFADVCIQDGGLFGDIANLLFRQETSEKIRKMLPSRICGMLPDLVNTRVNPMLSRLPQSVSFNQIASLFTGLLGSSIPAHCFSPMCQARLATMRPPIPGNAPALPPRNPPSPAFVSGGRGAVGGVRANTARGVAFSAVVPQMQAKFKSSFGTGGGRTKAFGAAANGNVGTRIGTQVQRGSPLVPQSQVQYFSQPHQKLFIPFGNSFARIRRAITRNEVVQSNMLHNNTEEEEKQRTVILQLIPRVPEVLPEQRLKEIPKLTNEKNPSLRVMPHLATQNPLSDFAGLKETNHSGAILSSIKQNRSAVRGVPVAKAGGYSKLPAGPNFRAPYQPVGAVGVAGGFMAQINDPCASCPPSALSRDSFGATQNLIKQQFDLRKLADLVLQAQLMRTYATFHDFTLDLYGEFSPYGRGGTPFSPFPMQWPLTVGGLMIEFMISDFTFNSLLYWMHRNNFLSFRVGPETPGIGPLLTTTCDISSDYPEEDFENESLLFRLLRLSQRRRHYRLRHQQRSKRQATAGDNSGASSTGGLGDLADLGICIGDIIPAIKERHPNRTLALVIRTVRAPSITLSGRFGGSAQINLIVFVDIYLDQTDLRVGSLTVTVIADIMLRIIGNRIIGNASLPVLKLDDQFQNLGLQQDALENLASLAKDMILRAANQELNRGVEVSLPTATLPINIISPQIRIVDRAFYIGTDFTVGPTIMQMIS